LGDLASAVRGETAGNLKCCGKAEDEVFRLAKGDPKISGVVGAVPALRLGGLSAAAESESKEENEEIKGEGCVVDRWLIGAADVY
jgi:hypothetical protein